MHAEVEKTSRRLSVHIRLTKTLVGSIYIDGAHQYVYCVYA